MHLLATESGIIADGSAAVDLGQSPGDIVVLASADTELALLPGDDKPDAELARLSTVPHEICQRLWRYLAEGGPGNADSFLRFAANLAGGEAGWAEGAPLLAAGLYWPGHAVPSLDDIVREWQGGGGVVPIVFYRA